MAASGASKAGAREVAIGQKLLDPSLDATAKLRVATEMRESVERELDYAQFIAHCLPSIVSILNNGKISMLANSPEHVRGSIRYGAHAHSVCDTRCSRRCIGYSSLIPTSSSLTRSTWSSCCSACCEQRTRTTLAWR